LSQTPLWQTSAPASAEQVPFSVGSVCGASVGTFCPLASVGTHMCAVSLHHVPAVVQSASTLQPPAGSHWPFALQAPERHTAGPLVASHEPSPFA
jgi:hypothetical protein